MEFTGSYRSRLCGKFGKNTARLVWIWTILAVAPAAEVERSQ
jgi:hypothetical protein